MCADRDTLKQFCLVSPVVSAEGAAVAAGRRRWMDHRELRRETRMDFGVNCLLPTPTPRSACAIL